MEDLKVYYKTEDVAGAKRIDAAMDKEIEKIAEKFKLAFCGSGVEIGTGIRDLHYSSRAFCKKTEG